MAAAYRLAVKASVFRDTSLSKDDFDEPVAVQFADEEDAEQWVDRQNQSLDSHGKLTLHTAHPNDDSDVNAYLVSRPQGVWTVD